MFSEDPPWSGFRIRLDFDRPGPELLEAFEGLDVADISDQMNRLYAVDPQIKCLAVGKRLIGPACTVRVFPGDNLMVHKSLDVAQPGDVVVIDARGSVAERGAWRHGLQRPNTGASRDLWSTDMCVT